MKSKLSTKTGALIVLQKKLNTKNCEIPKFIFFSKNKYINKKNLIFKSIAKNFKKEIILRSSSLSEDKIGKSNAGKYKSFQNVKIDKKIIFEKIKEITDEYNSLDDQIIVQDFKKKILYSGVIFTRDQNTNAPYYIINFDRSGKTDLVTSGRENPSSKTLIIYRNAKKVPPEFKNLLLIVRKIETIFKSDKLDIEFAIEKKTKKIFIFQCRSLNISNKFENFDNEIEITINNIKKKLIKLKKKNIYTPGSTTILSNMADWNPAEMIGSKPKNLSLSLYSELITNEIWGKQRYDYGYSNSSPNNLMINLAGSPYIDLRVDLNSFIPKDLSVKIKNKIINYSINKIEKKPQLHDKIEFDVIPTCYDFSDNKNFKNALSTKELSEYNRALKKLTFNLLENYKNIFKKEVKKLNQLLKQIKIIKYSKLSHIQKIFYLVNDCKKSGTLPFAGLARLAFISTKILKSFVKEGILKTNEYNLFFNSLNTIARQMDNDLSQVLKKNSNKYKFIKKYGHLRPSTYSLSSPNYKSNFHKYFPEKKIEKEENKKFFKIQKSKYFKIDTLFKRNRLNLTAKDFFKFAKKSIELREWGKFIFTKSLDEIFYNLEALGNEVKISKKDLEYVSINTILEYNSNLDQQRIKNLMWEEIKKNKNSSRILEQIKLPDLISNVKLIENFFLNNIKGNYVTDKSTQGKVIYLKNVKSLNQIKDKVVLIENADPGYDFIFSYNIKGFISKYGGANSHMAIRCMELGIPAIIGIGEKNFQNLKLKNFLYMDCKQQIFRIIS